jgi:hypothetical protein
MAVLASRHRLVTGTDALLFAERHRVGGGWAARRLLQLALLNGPRARGARALHLSLVRSLSLFTVNVVLCGSERGVWTSDVQASRGPGSSVYSTRSLLRFFYHTLSLACRLGCT